MRGLVGSPIAPEVDQAELADLHLIAVRSKDSSTRSLLT